jgi:transposase-like protein
MDRDSLALLLAQGVSMEEIARRFGKNASTIAYWVDKHRLEVPNREKYAARGAIERQRLVELIEAGMTIAEIAAAVDAARRRCATGLAGTG